MQTTHSHRAPWPLLVLLGVVVALLAFVLAVPDAHAAATARGALSFNSLSLFALAVGDGAGGGGLFTGILPAELDARLKRAFFAPLRWAPIAFGVTAAAQLLADVNHDIIVSRIAYTARDAATLAMLDRPPLFAEISLASGILFTPGQQQRVELENFAGVNRGSPDLLIPIIIPAGEIFQILLTNGTAATNMNVQVDLIGARAAKVAR